MKASVSPSNLYHVFIIFWMDSNGFCGAITICHLNPNAEVL